MKLQSIALALIMAIQLNSANTPPPRARLLEEAMYQTPPATIRVYQRTSPFSYPMQSGIDARYPLTNILIRSQQQSFQFAGFEPTRERQVCQSKTPKPCNSRPFLLANSRIW